MGQKGQESTRAAAYFEEYAAMGPERSLEKLAKQLYETQEDERNTKETTWLRKLKEFSIQHNWQERIKERDREVAREKRRKYEEERQRMNDEHALLGRTHALRAAKMIQELSEQGRMSSTAAVTLLKIATDLERLARGAETEITKTIEEQPKQHRHTIAFDLSRLSDEQLERLEQLAEEIDPGEEEE